MEVDIEGLQKKPIRRGLDGTVEEEVLEQEREKVREKGMRSTFLRVWFQRSNRERSRGGLAVQERRLEGLGDLVRRLVGLLSVHSRPRPLSKERLLDLRSLERSLGEGVDLLSKG